MDNSIQDIKRSSTASRTKHRITKGRMKPENREYLEENLNCAEDGTKPETLWIRRQTKGEAENHSKKCCETFSSPDPQCSERKFLGEPFHF